MFLRKFFPLTVLTLTATIGFSQGNETIHMRSVRARRLAGFVTVRGDNTQPISAVHVEECDADWQYVLASTVTDASGHFHLKPVGEGSTHYLRIYAPGFDVSEYPVRLSRFAHAELHLEIGVGT